MNGDPKNKEQKGSALSGRAADVARESKERLATAWAEIVEAARTPVGRIGRPEDIAQAIAFLIGNGFTTGHTLICDGGIRLGQ